MTQSVSHNGTTPYEIMKLANTEAGCCRIDKGPISSRFDDERPKANQSALLPVPVSATGIAQMADALSWVRARASSKKHRISNFCTWPSACIVH